MSSEIKTNIHVSSNNSKEQKNGNFNSLYKAMNNKNEYSILSLLIEDNKNNKRKNSLNTADTEILTQIKLDYNFKELKKFDELNHSLSEISEFDLEKNDQDKSDFNSSQDNNSELEEEIIIKKRITIINRKDNLEYEDELEKDFEKIIKELNLKK